jgi:hypothetical protein
MAIDKRANYDMQGHKKPARNYLGKQKTVKNIPIKWKSGPKAPETELAYITKAEKDLLLKKDLHGSLKHGPNTGPDGIMSLDSQGDYTRDRSPQGAPGGPGKTGDPGIDRAVEQRMKDILTGNVTTGQTAAVSARTRRGAVPEWVTTPSGQRKYVGSAYKDTGRRGFLSRLFGGANRYGYGQTYGTGSGRFFDRKSIHRRGTTGKGGTLGYFSEDEEVGDIKPGYGGRILGGLAGLATGIPFVGPAIGGAIDRFKPQPKDMSEFNKYGLGGSENYLPQGTLDFDPNALINQETPDVPMATNIEGYNWTGAEGGRPGYRKGLGVDPVLEVQEDENIYDFMQDQGISQGEMASGPGVEESLNEMSMEIFGKPLEALTEEEYDILIDLSQQQAANGEGQGLASLV